MISNLLLVVNIFLLFLIIIDALLIKKYYRRYYVGMKMPFEWKLIILGLVLFPLLSKTTLIMLKYDTGTKIVVLLYALPTISAVILCFGALVLWRKFRL